VGDYELSQREERELEELMESDEDDAPLDEDDEEAIYERLITEVIQESKLAELQKNFQIEQSSLEDIKTSDFESTDPTLNGTAPDSALTNKYQEKTYTPTKSGSWGVFERPADISKAYGGVR